MDMNRKQHRLLALNNWGFVLMFMAIIGLLAWLSTRYNLQSDWTASGRHTLSKASIEMLASLEDEVQISAFARPDEISGLRKRIREMVERYQLHKADMRLEFIDPDTDPDRVRAEGISVDGELLITYQGRKENLKRLGEQALTNALMRLKRSQQRRIVFLSGHGERRPGGEANHDIGEWTGAMEEKGFIFRTQTLSIDPFIPEDTAVLVIASPQTELLEGEVEIINEYVAAGGNLLWLTEPGRMAGLELLADELGLAILPGTVLDTSGQQVGIEHPAMVLVAEYPHHAVTEDLLSVTLFPFVAALGPLADTRDWQQTPVLRSLPGSWVEVSPLDGEVGFEENVDLPGPVTLGMVMERGLDEDNGDEETPMTIQRVVVIGDGDFLSNTYLGNGVNRDLGERLLNWLSHDDELVTIAPRVARDTRLEMSKTGSLIIGLGFLIIIPLSLVITGVWIWHSRRKR